MTDPVDPTVPPPPPTGAPTLPQFRPATPKMGGLLQVSATEWCPWTGGKPKADWSGLDSSADRIPAEDYQLRPTSPSSAQKSTAFRETGLETKFSQNSDLLDL